MVSTSDIFQIPRGIFDQLYKTKTTKLLNQTQQATTKKQGTYCPTKHAF
jgi:hypothetical protein